jgi:transposase-like protein
MDSQEGANHGSPCWLGRRPARTAKPYSRDLRERMVRTVQAGQRQHEVARIFGVSASCVIKLMHCYEATGDDGPGKFGGHKRSALIGFEDKLRGLVAEQPSRSSGES